MMMGGRVEDLEIDVLFLFLSLFVDGKFATFSPPGIEGDLRRGEDSLCKSDVVGEGVGGQD